MELGELLLVLAALAIGVVVKMPVLIVEDDVIILVVGMLADVKIVLLELANPMCLNT